MKVELGNGKSQYGPGVDIFLDGNEVATAIDTYLVAHGIYVQGPRTIFVNGDQCESGGVYVDPSGFVIDNGKKIEGGPMFKSTSLVGMLGQVRLCSVVLTETAMIKPHGYIFMGDELYFVEVLTDDYDWGNYRNKVAAKVTRREWMAGVIQK
jgi:hypothetical protein